MALHVFLYTISQYQLASATFVYVVFLPGLELPREACIKRIKKLYSVYSTHKRIL